MGKQAFLLSASRIGILVLVGCACGVLLGQASTRSQLAAALDSWSDRAGTRGAILKITHDPVPLLASIATTKDDPDVRRLHAIAILATFKTERSKQALDQLADDPNPKCRCAALQSMAELESRGAIPVLIRKLDDQAVCMEAASTDPPEEHDVYVSDEAVRLLEHITGQSTATESVGGHRATRPWRKWWAAQQRASGK